MFGLGVGEVLAVLVIALIFIGPKKLPGLAKGLGKGMREFQNAMKGISTTLNTEHTVDKTLENEFKDDPVHDQKKSQDDLDLEAKEKIAQSKSRK